MATSPHDLGTAGAMGAQFKTNVLDKAPSALTNMAKASIAQNQQRARAATQARDRFADSALNLTNQGRANVARNAQTRMATAQGAAIRENEQRQRAQRTQVTNAHSEAIRENTGRQRTMTSQINTAHGAALREDSSRASNVTRQRTAAHGEALREQAGRQNIMRQQVNTAHTEALREGTARSRVISPGTPRVSRVSSPATPASTGGSVQSSSQFANVAPRDNSPYPTHQPPAGSSNLKLPTLTAAQPKPNEFTVGSRAAKPGGIAAKGSQLEAWAQSKTQAVQARTASRRAGGRDKGLATTAKKAENFANQPIRNFAP